MTMQRGDYLRISRSLHSVRDKTLDTVATKDTETQSLVRTSYRDLAVSLAQGFLAVNTRFRVDMFLFDALGQSDGERALASINIPTEDNS